MSDIITQHLMLSIFPMPSTHLFQHLVIARLRPVLVPAFPQGSVEEDSQEGVGVVEAEGAGNYDIIFALPRCISILICKMARCWNGRQVSLKN